MCEKGPSPIRSGISRYNIVLALAFSVLLYGCSGVSGSEFPPSSEEEFEAEARIISMDDGITLANARNSLAQVYPEFSVEESGFFSPPGRYIEFINCTSSVDPDVYNVMGRTVVTYSYRGSMKRITLTDSCSDRTMAKYYCVGDRPAFVRHRCSRRCWQDYHCM